MDTEGLDAVGAKHDNEKLVFGDWTFSAIFLGPENLKAPNVLSFLLYGLKIFTDYIHWMFQLRRYLTKLKDSNKKWIHAIIWCIIPEPKVFILNHSLKPKISTLSYSKYPERFCLETWFSQEDTRVSEQARFISMFENEESERSIWENVIILARKGVNNRNDEGFQVFRI